MTEYHEYDDQLIPPSWRKPIWRLYGLVGLVIGAIAVAYTAAEVGVPTWVVVSTAVYTFLGAPLGFVAQRNVR